MSSKERGRALGSREAICYHVGKSLSGWYVGVIQTSTFIQDSVFREAFKIIFRKQEMLQMRIEPTPNEHGDVRDLQLKPREDPEDTEVEVVSLRSKDDWPAIVARDNTTKQWDTVNGPLCRILVGRVADGANVKNVDCPFEYVIFTKSHHSIVDAASTFYAVNHQIIPTLSALMDGNDIEQEIPFCPMTKSVEELFLDPNTLENPVPWYVRKVVDAYRWFNRYFMSESEILYKFPDESLSPGDNQDNESRYIRKIFNEELCDAIIASAKRNGVSVHCVLLFVGVLAFSRTAKAAGVNIPKSIQQVWPIDLRRFLFKNESKQSIGFMTNTCVTKHRTMTDCTREEFWENCKRVLRSIIWQVRRQNIVYGLRLSKYFLDAVQSSTAQTVLSELGYEPRLHLTNFGITKPALATRDDGSTAIKLTEQYSFATGSQEKTFISLLQYLLTYEGKFHCVFYRNSDTSKRFAETYVQNFENILNSYCVPENSPDK